MNSLDHPIALLALQQAPFGILVTDGAQQISWINGQLARWLEVECKAIQGKTLQQFEQHERIHALVGEENIIALPNSEREILYLQRNAVSTEIGEKDINIWFFQDVTELTKLGAEREQLSGEVNRLSMKDPVSGLMTQRALLLALEPQVARSRRYDHDISVLAINVDLAAYTSAQNESSKKIAQFLKNQLRWADLVGRSEEGNFIVILPETKKDDARKIAQKISSGLHELISDPLQGERNTAPAFGITQWRRSDDAHALLKRASQALHDALDTADHAIQVV